MSVNNVQSSLLTSYIQQQKAQGPASEAPKAPAPQIEEPKIQEAKPDTLEITKPQEAPKEVQQETEKEAPSKLLDKIKDKAKKLFSNKKALIAFVAALGIVIAIVLIARHDKRNIDPASPEMEEAVSNLVDAFNELFN